NHDFDALHLVVADTVRVPWRRHRLHVLGRIGRAAAELVLPRRFDLPFVTPRLPGEVVAVACQPRIRPRSPAVGADLDTNDAPVARPSFAFEDAAPEPKLPRARQEIGDTRRHHQRARQHPGHGLAQLVPGAGDVIRGPLLIPAERPRHHRDRPEPLDMRHAVPPGTTSRTGKPCWGGSGWPLIA